MLCSQIILPWDLCTASPGRLLLLEWQRRQGITTTTTMLNQIEGFKLPEPFLSQPGIERVQEEMSACTQTSLLREVSEPHLPRAGRQHRDPATFCNQEKAFQYSGFTRPRKAFHMYYTSLYKVTLSITGRPFSSLSPQPFLLLCSQQDFFWVGSEVEEREIFFW